MTNQAETLPTILVSSRARRLTATIAGAIFIATTFTASSLLFLIQPMFAKMALPQLGGSPSVWNTCVLFFQATLLLAYLYAHVSVRYLGARLQAVSHVGLLLLPLLVLPVSAPIGGRSAAENPTFWLLRSMTVTVGLPFFCVATMAPLIQRWFAVLPLRSAADPYFLYAASNLGSMLALIAFPLWLEPAYGVRSQASGWVFGYVALIALTAGCVLTVWTYGDRAAARTDAAAPGRSVSGRDRVFWVLVSFVPSSLMLGVTTHISTDLAAVPLLWILPLALYLATFIAAFSGTRRAWTPLLGAALPFLVLAAIASVVLRMAALYLIPFHLAVFFACAMACHLRLAHSRPSAEHLTEFYLWLSFGGVLGGVFNTLIAPHVFNGVYEYTLVLALVCLLTARPDGTRPVERWAKFGVSATVPFVACLMVWAMTPLRDAASVRQILVVVTIVIAGFWAPAVRRAPFNIAVLALSVLPALLPGGQRGQVLFSDRSFFGVMKVLELGPNYHLLQHGTTLHGRQDMTIPDGCEPLSYFHRNGPIGQVFATFNARFSSIGIIGLGSGALACYAERGDRMTFFEIDPLVQRIATDERLFTFIRNSAGDTNIAIGDGRKLIETAPKASYDLIIVDAFSSDSVPVHLLTREALATYMSKLRGDGVLAIHISNRYLELESIVAATAAAEQLPAIANRDLEIPPDDQKKGRTASHWIVATRDEGVLSTMLQRRGWYSLSAGGRVRAWTDDYSNILDALILR